MLMAVMLIGGGMAYGQSYLCDLTQTEVEDLLDGYSAPQSFQEVAPYVASPFDCETYGDLCDLVGSDNAKTHVCGLWDMMRNGDSTSAIDAAMTSGLQDLIEDWFDERFPSGVGPGHPYLGPLRTSGTYPATCGPFDSVRKNLEDGSILALRSRAFTTNLGIFWEIGAVSKALAADSDEDPFSRVYTADVTIEGDFESDAGCSETKSKSDDDGRVSVNFSGFIFNKPYEEVVGEGEAAFYGYELSGTRVCAEAGWTDPC